MDINNDNYSYNYLWFVWCSCGNLSWWACLCTYGCYFTIWGMVLNHCVLGLNFFEKKLCFKLVDVTLFASSGYIYRKEVKYSAVERVVIQRLATLNVEITIYIHPNFKAFQCISRLFVKPYYLSNQDKTTLG